MKIHIISHTHWDREWYRPFQYFKVKLSYFFNNLFDIMENDDEYKHFMLDGQMVMIEDYLNLEPQNKQKIKQLVNQGRLIIGPWYSQPDEFAPDGESLVRNLLIGSNMASEYGKYMQVGYLPDSFGQSCQMPQILKGCNIDSACVMRGVPAHKLERTEFIWRGLNKDEVLTVALPKGYSNGMFLPKDNIPIDIRMKKIIHDIKQIGNKDNILVMNGVDHQFPQPQIAKYIKSKNAKKYLHSTLEKYIEDAGKNTEDIVKFDGELISPVTNRVHTSIASSRMYQKTKNRELETLLENRVEPLCTMAWIWGADYPQAIINSAWKEMLKNQAHDSICGCCTDEVHREIDQRFCDAQNMGTTLKKIHSRSICAAIAGKDLVLTVFNDSMVKGKQRVDAVIYCEKDNFILVDDSDKEIDYIIEQSEKIDAATMSIWSLYLETPCIVNKVNISFEIDFEFNWGFKRLVIKEGIKPKNNINYHNVDNKQMENHYSVVTLNPNGTFNLLDKQTGKEYSNLNTIEDCGDAGDTYNYSPVVNDVVITNTSVKDCKTKIKKSLNMTIAEMRYSLDIPIELTEDDKSRSKEMTAIKIKTEITLYENIKRIDIKTKLQNNAKDHRMRAVFPTGIHTEHSYAETQFGTIKRDNVIEDVKLWKENKWAEKPLPIYSNHKFVDVNDSNFGLAVFNRGLTEYEVYEMDGSAIAITLFRGVSYMGKPDLTVRPGRPSGINIATPDAQCLGAHVLEYSVFAHTGNTDEGEIAKYAAQYNAKPTAVQSKIKLSPIAKKYKPMLKLFDLENLQQCAQGNLANVEQSDFGFISIDNDKLIISAIKKAENEDAIILRVYNSTAGTINSAEISINKGISKVFGCNFLEENTTELKHNNQRFKSIKINGYTAQTYKIVLK